MRDLLATSVSILNEYWSGVFSQTYRTTKTSDGNYTVPRAVYSSIQNLWCEGKPLAQYNAYFCSSASNAPYVAWDERFLDDQARKTGSAAAVWVIAAHEWGHYIQWLLDVTYQGNDPDLYELGADCLAGAASGQIARQGYFSAPRIRGALDTLGNIADQYKEQGTHGTAPERQASFERGFTSGAQACINRNR
jgi:predicted metalloprotease